MIPPPPRYTLFPYTTLFRSRRLRASGDENLCIRRMFDDRKDSRSEEHTSELQSRGHLVCRLLLEKKKNGVHGRAHRPDPTGRASEPTSHRSVFVHPGHLGTT